MIKHRPWGEVRELLRQSTRKWNLIGCISFEDRCIGVNYYLHDKIESSLYLDITGPESPFLKNQIIKKNNKRGELNKVGSGKKVIVEFPLHAQANMFINTIKQYISDHRHTKKFILDVSCFPKRYFFPILKILMSSDMIEELVVTYSKPQSYTSQELSGDPGEWSHLPAFMSQAFPEPTAEVAVIGVGFMHLGINKLLTGRYKEAIVNLLFPFPPGPPNYQRNWDFVRRIENFYPKLDHNKIHRIHALSLSDTYDYLISITNNGKKNSILAPYGPKPISVGMALFAINYGVPVYYSQPNFYSDEYSSGIKESYGYLVKRDFKGIF